MRTKFRENRKPKAIVVTGNLCSGKTTFAELFAKSGYICIDTDQVAKRLIIKRTRALLNQLGVNVELITSIAQIKNERRVFDQIAKLVFTNKKLLIKWEKIIHPAVYKEVEKKVISNKTNLPTILLIPLFFESKTRKKNSWPVVLLYSDRSSCLRRAKKKGVSFPENRLERQKRFEEVIMRSDFIVFNVGSLKHLQNAAHLLSLMLGNRSH